MSENKDKTGAEVTQSPPAIPRGAYLFLGMPGAGKTVFFTIMCRLLQQEGLKNGAFNFEFIPGGLDPQNANSTRDYIVNNWDCIEQRRWPGKTSANQKVAKHCVNPYVCELSHKRNFLWPKKYTICNIDYPGESFRAAFSPHGTYDGASDSVRNIALLLKSAVDHAKGVFLLIDAENIFNADDKEKNDIDNRLGALFRYIRDKNRSVRVAVVFNKMELFDISKDPEESVYKVFTEKYSNACAAMQLLSSYSVFFAYPFGKIDRTADGDVIPPESREPKNMLEIAEWIFDVKKGTLKS